MTSFCTVLLFRLIYASQHDFELFFLVNNIGFALLYRHGQFIDVREVAIDCLVDFVRGMNLQATFIDIGWH